MSALQEEEKEELVLMTKCQACGKEGHPSITAHDVVLDSNLPIDWSFCGSCAVAFVTRRLPSHVVRGMRRDAKGFTRATDIRYYNKRGQPQSPLLVAKESGWLAPDGTFHPCEFGFHEKWAERNGMSTKLMEKQGWMRLRWGDWQKGARSVTQSQLDALWDWCQANGAKLPEWAKR